MSLRREPMAYRKAIRAASFPWNQRLEQRAAASTSKLHLPAACLNCRLKPRTVSTEMQGHAQRTVLTRRRSPSPKVLGDFFE
jgi:hypothetical protein